MSRTAASKDLKRNFFHKLYTFENLISTTVKNNLTWTVSQAQECKMDH